MLGSIASLSFLVCSQLCSTESTRGTFHGSPRGPDVLAHSPCPSSPFLLVLYPNSDCVDTLHPSFSSNPRTWLGPPVLLLPLLQPGNLQPPNAEVGGLSVCGASRVSRPARHLSKCRVSLKQCQTSRDSNFLPAFLTGEADSLYIPIVLRLFSPP